MKNLKKLLPSAVSVVLAAGIGFSSGTQAIHLSEDGVGQVLLAPFYMANYQETGYDTHITVINPLADTAIKAKFVVRSAVNSTEVLDFILYLTPSDVWRGRIYQDGVYTSEDAEAVVNPKLVGKPKIVLYSDDDSMKSPVLPGESYRTICSSGCDIYSGDGARATFASLKPVKVNLFTDRIIDGIDAGTETLQMGHIEVVGVYGARGTVRYADRQAGQNDVEDRANHVRIVRGMSKFDLAKVFDETRFKLNRLNGTEVIAVTRDDNGNLIDQNGLNYNTQNAKIRTSDPDWVKLSGDVTLRIGNYDRMTYPFYALAGSVWDNIPFEDRVKVTQNESGVRVFSHPTGLGRYSTLTRPYLFDGRVLVNPYFDAEGGLNAPETAIGLSFGSDLSPGLVQTTSFIPVAQTGIDNLLEIEHALAATNLYGSYESSEIENTSLVVTFPTRYRHRVRAVTDDKLREVVLDNNNPCAAELQGEDVPINPATGKPIREKVYSPPFRWTGLISPSVSAYNNFEQLIRTSSGSVFSGGMPLPDQTIINLVEVNYVIRTWPYDSGWFDMIFSASLPGKNDGYAPGCNYAGVPVLGLAHKFFTDAETGISNSLLLPMSRR